MAADTKMQDDILRLNALVDGELAPGERAAVAARLASDRDYARAYATLARLKATVVESADTIAPIEIVVPARKPTRLALGVAMAAVVGGLIVLAAATSFLQERQTASDIASEAIILAALPEAPVVPDLGRAGLRLERARIEAMGDARILVAVFLGPRGCRLELRVQRADAVSVVAQGTERRAWIVGGLAYELTAFGMPSARFAALADAAEMAAKGPLPDLGNRRLREARVASGPCVG